MPRKTRTPRARRAPIARASMRPRPDAAENDEYDVWIEGVECASMRPRPDAAENPPPAAEAEASPRASMRPRPDAAENGGDGPKFCADCQLQ